MNVFVLMCFVVSNLCISFLSHQINVCFYSNGKQSLSLNILLLTQLPLRCVVGFSNMFIIVVLYAWFNG